MIDNPRIDDAAGDVEETAYRIQRKAGRIDKVKRSKKWTLDSDRQSTEK